MVRTLLPAVPKMKFWELLLRLTVPVPLSVTFPLIIRFVMLPPEASVSVPLLVIVPAKVVLVLLLTW